VHEITIYSASLDITEEFIYIFSHFGIKNRHQGRQQIDNRLL